MPGTSDISKECEPGFSIMRSVVSGRIMASIASGEATVSKNSTYRPSSGRNCDSGHLPPREGFFSILSASAPIYHAQSLQLRPYKNSPAFLLLYHPIFFPAS